MLVVLDTTETFTHFWLDCPRVTLLLSFAQATRTGGCT